MSAVKTETVRGPFRFVCFPLGAHRYSCDVYHSGVREFTAYGEEESDALEMATSILDGLALLAVDKFGVDRAIRFDS